MEKIELSKESWTYRFLNKEYNLFFNGLTVGEHVDMWKIDDTCAMRRAVMFKLFELVFKTTIILFVFGIFISFALFGLYLPLAWVFDLPTIEIVVTGGVIFWVLVALFLSAICKDFLGSTDAAKPLRVMYSSAKERVCKRIVWKD